MSEVWGPLSSVWATMALPEALASLPTATTVQPSTAASCAATATRRRTIGPNSADADRLSQKTSSPPDEDFTHGFPQEVEAFYRTVVYGDPVESDSQLAADTISTVYSRYLSAEQEGAQVTVELL